jgi:hypothetical protein
MLLLLLLLLLLLCAACVLPEGTLLLLAEEELRRGSQQYFDYPQPRNGGKLKVIIRLTEEANYLPAGALVRCLVYTAPADNISEVLAGTVQGFWKRPGHSVRVSAANFRMKKVPPPRVVYPKLKDMKAESLQQAWPELFAPGAIDKGMKKRLSFRSFTHVQGFSSALSQCLFRLCCYHCTRPVW